MRAVQRQVAKPGVDKTKVATAERARASIALTRLAAPAGCACGGDCPRCRSEARSSPAASPDEAPPIVHRVLREPGRPLDPAVRASMEQRFGEGFGTVRLHTDAQAAQSARAVQAIAYTVGPNIVFAAGRYAPHTDAGSRTLAHELAHVVQQRGATPSARLRIAPAHDAVEQEAERVAAGGAVSSVRAASPAGASVQTLRRQTDASVESGTGVGTGIADGTMNEVGGVHGATFDASDCFGVDECDVHFEFQKAYVGTYPYRAAPGRTVRGAYVKIVMRAEPGCGDCSTLEAVQILRNTRRDRRGELVTADPGTAVRRRRSGWGDRNAPSRGWRVDALESERDPFYTHSWVGTAGTGGSPAIIWDTPGDWDTDRNAGKDFQTCLICVAADGARSTLGCVNWGYYTDASRNIGFLPATPVPQCGSSPELRDAARRWEGMRGNQPLYLQGHVPPGAPGDFPLPRGETRFA